MQKAAEYNTYLQDPPQPLPEEESQACKRLEAEYLVLRMVLVSFTRVPSYHSKLIFIKAWKEDRLEIAENLYYKTEKLVVVMDTVLVESFADTLFEIGKCLASKKDFSLAAKWLERSYEVINTQAIEELSRDAVELRMAISQAMVHAYLNSDTHDGFKKAENHVAYLESEVGDKLTVLLLRLELILKSPAEVFDSDTFASILRRLIRSTDLSETTLKIMLHHINTLCNKSPSLACKVLDSFISSAVLPSQRKEWIEKAMVFRAKVATSGRDTLTSIQSLVNILDTVADGVSQPLGVPATLSIQTVR